MFTNLLIFFGRSICSYLGRIVGESAPFVLTKTKEVRATVGAGSERKSLLLPNGVGDGELFG
jgi:hypothetical protein